MAQQIKLYLCMFSLKDRVQKNNLYMEPVLDLMNKTKFLVYEL